MKIVEVVRGSRTEERYIDGLVKLAEQAGHFAVTTKWARLFWDQAASVWPSTKGLSSP